MSQKGFAPVILIILVLLIAVAGGVFIFGDNANRDDSGKEVPFLDYQDLIVETSDIPNNLSLPFKIDDLSISSAILNPLGIIRHDRDSGHGHGGIDFPLTSGSQVIAVADGEIVEISKVSSLSGDEKLVTLLESTSRGEGWVFIYEHILINDALKKGDKVRRSEVLGTHMLDSRTSHYQLSHAFNNLEFYDSGQCWPELLISDDQKALNSFWEIYRKSDHALGVWESVIEDGNYAYLALLDKGNYPDGMQLCYPVNTDARVPAN